METEMRDVAITCTMCGGSGEYEYSGVGPVDNTDVWSFLDLCVNCGATGSEYVGLVELVV